MDSRGGLLIGGSAFAGSAGPLCYQDMPAGLLPEALKDDNPLGIARQTDGVLSTGRDR